MRLVGTLVRIPRGAAAAAAAAARGISSSGLQARVRQQADVAAGPGVSPVTGQDNAMLFGTGDSAEASWIHEKAIALDAAAAAGETRVLPAAPAKYHQVREMGD
ncbi:hypothetical protein GGF46_005494 [Coemansia sp. RSA 552]|nr:hypothetical protein GGF46_005494 [Coemansia sp. RSA 552]